jgi:hypothetical protein
VLLGGQADGYDDPAPMSPFPLERGAAVAECDRLNLGNLWWLLMLPKKIENRSLSFCMPETSGNGHLLTSGGTQHERLQ